MIKGYPSFFDRERKICWKEIVDEVSMVGWEMRISGEDIAKIYGISLKYAREILRYSTEETLHQRIQRITLDCYAEGKNLRETATLAGVRISEVEKILRNCGRIIREEPPLSQRDVSKLSSDSNEEKREEIKAILEGKSVHEIGRMFGFSGENARLKIHDYGLYGNWTKAREDKRNESYKNKINEKRLEILNILRDRKSKLEEDVDENLSIRLAEKHYVLGGKFSIQELHKLFTSYFGLEAKKMNYLSDISSASGLPKDYCGKVLNKAGLRVRKRNKAMNLKAS